MEISKVPSFLMQDYLYYLEHCKTKRFLTNPFMMEVPIEEEEEEHPRQKEEEEEVVVSFSQDVPLHEQPMNDDVDYEQPQPQAETTKEEQDEEPKTKKKKKMRLN